MRKDSLKNKIKIRIRRRKDSVAMIGDFLDFSTDRDQIQRILRQLMNEGVVVRVGKGVYVRAKRSSISGALVPDIGLREIATRVIEKTGGEVRLTPTQQAYNERKITQVPNMDYVGTNKRISRKLTLNKRQIIYEMVK